MTEPSHHVEKANHCLAALRVAAKTGRPVSDYMETVDALATILPLIAQARSGNTQRASIDAPRDAAFVRQSPAPVTADAGAAAPVSRDAVQADGLVRFCPACGSVGDVEAQYRDCCPDGNQAGRMPKQLAEHCRDLFKLAISAATQPVAAAAEEDARKQSWRAIGPLPVERDESGWWSHPAIPNFDEDHKAYKAWVKAVGLETTYKALESDPDHPLYDAWFERGECDASSWKPTPPAGAGWFTFSIHDTEDGPVWVWARRVADASPSPVESAKQGGSDGR